MSNSTAGKPVSDGGSKLKYMLLIYANEQVWTDSEARKCYEDSARLACELNAQGIYVAANPLQSVSTATSVKVRDGKRVVTDGPFAETHEQLGGYFLIEADDLDDAITVAEQIPGVHKGTVEIRPVYEIPGLPAD
jgi:hypothetical protein